MEEVKHKLSKLIVDAQKYFKGIKGLIDKDLNSIADTDMMVIMGMSRILLKTHIMIKNTVDQYPQYLTNDITDFISEFKIFHATVERNFNQRINDIDSPSLDRILTEYKNNINFLENWVKQVYEPTVGLFTTMNPNKITDHTIETAFTEIGKHWHHKDMLMGICDDLKIYKTKLRDLDTKLNYLYRIVHNAKISKA